MREHEQRSGHRRRRLPAPATRPRWLATRTSGRPLTESVGTTQLCSASMTMARNIGGDCAARSWRAAVTGRLGRIGDLLLHGHRGVQPAIR